MPQQIEDLGISYVHNQVARMNFLFRDQSKHDFGIDAHIEITDEQNKGTSRNIALQIKSGKSYIKSNSTGDIVYYAENRHIQYWITHSLPVLLVIFDPDLEVAYWCDFKKYTSRNPQLILGETNKVVLSKNDIFDSSIRHQLTNLASMPQLPLVLDRQHFSLITLDDTSTGTTKRYKARILVGSKNKEVTRLAIYQAIEHCKSVEEHSSELRAKLWKNQSPHLIVMFIYRDFDDIARDNHIARALWKDESYPSIQNNLGTAQNDFVADIAVEFVNEEHHQMMKTILSSNQISKHLLMKKIDHWITLADQLIEQAKQLTDQVRKNEISVEAYEKEMSILAYQYTDNIEYKYDDGTIGPVQARDAEIRFVSTIGSGGNVFLAFTPRGLRTWTNKTRRDYMIQDYLKRYDEDREMLNFEVKKLSK